MFETGRGVNQHELGFILEKELVVCLNGLLVHVVEELLANKPGARHYDRLHNVEVDMSEQSLNHLNRTQITVIR